MGRIKGFKHSIETKNRIGVKSLGNKSRKGQKWSDSERLSHSISAPRGENHWEWIKDRTQLKTARQHQYDNRYMDWAKNVKNRDHWKCKISNESCSGRLEAHHILPWATFTELRYELNNGITLCHFHHPRKRDEEMRLSPFFQELLKA